MSGQANANEGVAQGSGFYSALHAAIDAGRGAPRRATVPQWIGWLDGAQRRGEFKQSERLWLGLDAWLAAQDGEVDRADLRRFVAGQEVRVQVIAKGDPDVADANLPPGWTVAQDDDDLWRVRNDQGRVEGTGLGLGDALRAVPGATRDIFSGRPRYGSHVLPGGDGYRETLVQLADGSEPVEAAVSDQVKRRHGPMLAAIEQRRLQAFGRPEYPKVLAEEGRLYSRMRRETEEARGRTSPPYVGRHYAEANVLVHLRTTLRTDAAGRRVLFVEEMQSDWHQDGRSLGYRVKDAADGEAVRPEAVPDAPLKNTGEWVTLAFKQALRAAVHSDCEVIAWTPGEIQAQRYDVSTTIENLSWKRRANGTVRLHGKRRDGNGSIYADNLTEAELIGKIGKALTEKVMRGVGQHEDCDPAEPTGTIEGIELAMGGQGMRVFYDQIVPQAVGKYVKSMGGSVVDVEVGVPVATGDRVPVRVPAVEITPAMRECALAGQPLFRRSDAPIEGPGMAVADVDRIVRDFLAEYCHPTLRPAVCITASPEEGVREWVDHGVNQTMAAYFRGGKVIHLAANRMRDRACVEATLRHELVGHYGLDTFLPEDKQAILDAIKASRSVPGMKSLWAEVDRRYGDRGEDARAEEIFARIAEQPRGPGARVLDQVLALMQAALRKVGLAKGETSRAELQVLAQSIGTRLQAGLRSHREDGLSAAPAGTVVPRASVDFLLARDQEARLRHIRAAGDVDGLEPDVGNPTPA